VSASWAEPAVTCTASQTFSSFWVGLDGDGTSTVEQTGTEADCANGAASYQGWFEMFPAAPVFFGNTVQPGDAMSASVVANGGGSFTLTLTEVTMESAGGVAEATPSALTDGDEFTVTADNGGAAGTTGAADGHRHRHYGLGG
jgi:Peptidase A4 family